MNTSTFRTNLKTLLDARSDFQTAGVVVHKYPPGKGATLKPTVFCQEITANKNDLTLLASQLAEYSVTGGGYVPAAGAADAQWATAETTAMLLVDGLQASLLADQTVGGACMQARLTSWTLTPTVEDGGRVFMDFTFNLTVRSVE